MERLRKKLSGTKNVGWVERSGTHRTTFFRFPLVGNICQTVSLALRSNK
ncbi:Uncharacterized protein dnm_015040 [Desulfonema magnum]|uniref:Uncharacterized protein n=1 Tax=Desulfonema magnum TaxID=45655 RepID=A0A975BHP9_9BACT|nr:Uncharacterized protein dnm_015040 [Desulfonema magnum]